MRITRKLASLLIALALVMPAFPLSALPAFADTASSSPQPLTTATETAAPDRVYADVPLNGALVTWDGSVIENCANCLEEDSEVIKEAEARMVEEDAEAEALVAELLQDAPSQEEVDAQLLAALKEDNVPFDPTLAELSPDAAAPQASESSSVTITSDSRTAARATSVAHPDYSLEVTLKDITGFDNASSSDSSSADIGGSIYIGYAEDGEYPKMRSSNIGIVRSYAFPTLSSHYFGYTEHPNPSSPRYPDVAMKMQLPAGQGEEAEEFELMFGSRWPGGNVRQEKNQWPTINDSTVLANFAKTEGYDASRTVAYQNAYKLAPFASYEDIIKSGNAIPANHPLATKALSESWPIHKTDGMKLALYEGDEENLVRYMVYFADGTHLISDIEYLGTRHLAASYVDSATGMLFQPDFWLIGEEGKAGVDFIASFIRSKTWSNYFNPVISKMNPLPDFNRIIKDHFDEKIHERAEEVAAELINYMDDWAATAADHQSWCGIINSSISKSPANNASNASPEPIMFNLLFFYTYYDRLFGIDIGGSEEIGYRKDSNIFKVMAFKGSVIKPGLSLRTMTAHMNFAKMYGLSQTGRINIVVFPTCVGELTGISEPPALVERAVRRTTDYADMNNWFAEYMSTFCFYKEYKPTLADPTPELEKLKWRGWDQARLHPTDLLLWLTIQEPGAMYFMTSPICIRFGSTHVYSANVEFNDTWRNTFISKMDKTGYPEARYAASLTSVCEAAQLNKVSILGIDQVVSKLDGGTSWLESEKLWGKTLTVDPFHKGYTDPMLRCQRSSQGAAIMSMNVSLEAKFIYYFMGQLSANWEYYQSHEIAHAIDNDVFLRGDRRAGTEDYTDGLLTQSYGSQVYIMNLSQDLAMTSDASANFTRERISTKEKLNDFYSKMYEAYDTLDYAMLKAFLRLDKDEQNALAMQLQYAGRDGSSQPDVGASAVTFIPRNTVLQNYDGTDATTPVTSSQFVDGSRKFETVEEVYDNQIVLFPGATGSFGWQQSLYVSTSLSGVYWHPIHANTYYADSRSFKVQMYRMLGREGYDAFANFGRAGGGQDLAKLKAITGYDSFRDWQLARWDEIESGKDTLAYVDFDELVDKFVDAMRADATGNDRKLTQMSNLRWRTYYLMKRVTNDFRYGLHDGNATPVTHIRTVADLQAVSQNRFGNYVLDADIDVSNVQPAVANTLVAGTFYGKLDGQGHRIISTSGPLPKLFEGVKHAYIKDVHLEGATSNAVALTVTNSEIENITFSVFERDIASVDDLVAMGADLDAGVRTFHLKSDLDLSGWSTANAAKETPNRAVVATMVKGSYLAPVVFNGNGHTLRNLNGASLFDKAVQFRFHEVDFEDCKNLQDAASADSVSLIANNTHECDFEDLSFNNVALSGRYRLGFVSANDGFIGPAGNSNKISGSRFKRIQVNNGSVLCGASSLNGGACYAGYIAGRVFNGDLEDISVRGTFTTYGVSCGGVIGAITGSARLNRCISNVDFTAGYAGNNGVLLGDIEAGDFNADATSIANSVALGNPGGNSVGRFAKFTANAKSVFRNCYENSDQKNGTSLGFDTQVDVSFVRTIYQPGIRIWDDSWKKEVIPPDYFTYPYLVDNQQFYLAMGYDESLWEYEKTIAKGYPMLRTPADEPLRNEYNIDAYVDFRDESIRLAGTDLSYEKTKIGNIYFRLYKDFSAGAKKGDWRGITTPMALNVITADVNRIEMGEAIDYENYLAYADVIANGYWTVVVTMSKADSGKSYDFEKLIRLPKRPEMIYADALVGVRADSKGRGSIRLVSVGSYDVAQKLEYRLKAADEPATTADTADAGGATGAAEGEGAQNPWIPMTSINTIVAPGEYEVRIAATDSSFASHATTVTVDEFDPDAVIFPLVLDAEGGSWAEGYEVPGEFNNEETTTLPDASVISREGYEFTGWYANEACTGEPVTQIGTGGTNAVVLYAGWRAREYPVALHLNGGTLLNPLDNVTKYTYGQAKDLPVPMRNDRIFVGWFDNEACEGDPVEAITSTDLGPQQFWAKWIAETYDVALELNGGTLVNGSTAFTYERGTGQVLPTAGDVTRDGYTFEGWYEQSNFAGDAVSAVSATDSGNKVFWARWSPVLYTVSMVLNGGRLAPGTSSSVSYIHGDEITLPIPERDGYEFAGWFSSANFADEPIAGIVPTDSGNKTLWAKWDACTYNVSYVIGTNTKGEAPPVDAFDLVPYGQYKSGSLFQLPGASTMVWEGHGFGGWYDNEELTGAPVTEIPVGEFGDHTFWAKWVSERAYVVTYYPNGGTFTTSPQTIFEDGVDEFAAGSPISLPDESTLSRDGYVFEGWYDNAAFEGEPLTSAVLELANTAFYAKWRKDQTPPPEPVDPGPDDPGPDNPPVDEDPFEISFMQFGDITFGEGGGNTIVWDEDTNYAKIRLPRSKMPQVASDFNLHVPEGIYVHSIDKREPMALHILSRVLRLSAEPETDQGDQGINTLASNSDVWDIELRKIADPTVSKIYTLEIEPLNDSDPDDEPNDPSTDPGADPKPSNPGPNPGNSGSGTLPTTGNDSGPDSDTPATRNPNTYGNDTTNGAVLPATGDETAPWPLIFLALGAAAAALGATCFLIQRGRRSS